MANYTYVVDSSYQPFSLQEMLVPFNAYKEAYEKSEEAYDKLSEADDFKYLSKTLPEGSAARALYEGYANDLHTQAEDLAQNGLTMGNRKALTSLKRRYRGEIGQLTKADEALKEEKKLRQTLNAQDSSRLYAVDNLSIDDFLEGKNPNLYSISGKELEAEGAEAGKSISSRIVNIGEGNITLGGYYRDLVSKYGYSQELLNQFSKDMNTIPELKAAFEDYMDASGVNQNLKGINKIRAQKYFINGMMKGAVYQENHNPQRDLGKLTAAEQSQADLTKRGQDIQLGQYGMYYDDKTKAVHYNKDKDPRLEQAKAIAEAKNNKGDSNSSSGTQLKGRLKLVWNGNTPTDDNGQPLAASEDYIKKNYYDDITYSDVPDTETAHTGQAVNYEDLPEFVKFNVDNIIGKGDTSNYYFYYQPFKSGTFDDNETEVEIVPKTIVKDTTNDETVSTGLHVG